MDALKHTIVVPSPAQTALGLLEESGFEAWCVGGFVRDALLGKPSKDIDITTNALWQDSKSLFEAAGYKTFETGIKHGTITVIIEGLPLEVTTFRVESAYSDRRHPDQVTFVSSLEDDLERRDFTINAIAYHPDRGIVDPFDGYQDLAAKTLRAVGNPKKRFTEDALRILRAIRFSSQLGFSIEQATRTALFEQATLLDTIAQERIASELDKFVCGAHIHDALMEYVDIVGQVIPEILPMKGLDQKTPYHIYDVLEHTAYVMEYTPPYSLVRWAALFHDSGKPASFFTDDKGVGHFYGHAKISLQLVRVAFKRLKMPTTLLDDVGLLVIYHDDVIEAKPKPVKRMLTKLHCRVDLFRALTDLKRGDAKAQAPHCVGRIELANDLDNVLDQIIEADEAFSLNKLALKGKDLIALGIKQGPQIGYILDEALEAVIDERIPNNHEALVAYAQELIESKTF